MRPAFEPFDIDGELDIERFKRFLLHCVDAGASDILIQSGDHAWAEIHGRQFKASTTTVKHAQILPLIDLAWGNDVLSAVRRGDGADRSLQLSGEADGLARGQSIRFRVNVIQARVAKIEKGIAITMRAIPQGLPNIRDMGVEEDLLVDFYPAKGLVLVCGPTGSGKTTLQAGAYALAGEIFPDRKVITYEDPIEFVLGGPHWKGPQPAQSEIGADVKSFAAGLRNAMRRKPSIVGIGEIRDLETCDAAIEVGLTGHLCYATMHTDSAGETINRAIQIYPPAQQSAVASRLLGALRVIVVQRLLKTTDGRRTAIRETVILDRELKSALQKLNYNDWAPSIQGMLEEQGRTLDDRAWALYEEGRIDRQEFIELSGAKAFAIRSGIPAQPEKQET